MHLFSFSPCSKNVQPFLALFDPPSPSVYFPSTLDLPPKKGVRLLKTPTPKKRCCPFSYAIPKLPKSGRPLYKSPYICYPRFLSQKRKKSGCNKCNRKKLHGNITFMTFNGLYKLTSYFQSTKSLKP